MNGSKVIGKKCDLYFLKPIGHFFMLIGNPKGQDVIKMGRGCIDLNKSNFGFMSMKK